MFGKLKEKLKSWTQGLVKKAEETEEEIEVEETIKETEEEQAKVKEEKLEKESKKLEKVKQETEKALDKKSLIVSKTKEEIVQNKKEVEIKELEKPLPETAEIKEEIVEEKIISKPEEKPRGFFGKLFGKKKEEKPKEETKQEEVTETPLQEQPETEEKGFLSKLKSKITKVKVSEEDFNTYAEDLEMILIENNVALEVAEKIIQNLKKRIVGKELLKKEIEGQIKESLKDIMFDVLIEPFDLIQTIREKPLKSQDPYVVLFCGINGTGKTTTIAKLAYQLKNKGISCILAGADTFRAASIEQIKKHGDALGLKVISHDYGSDPAAVGFDAISYAKKNKIQCVLIDTAGRMHTEKNLLREIEKISRVCNPDLKIFVGEAITGNDSIEQVRAFDSTIKIDAIILTKADTDEKGGTALSLGYITKKPILYLGIGQGYDSIEPFSKAKFIEALGL